MIDIYTSLGGYRMTWLSSVVTALFIIVVTYAVVALYREIAQGESVLHSLWGLVRLGIILLLGGLLITSLTTY
jgi:predicted phage tail protein